MNWQFENNSPIYTQLVRKYRLAIASGELAGGEKLPTVREVSAQAGVNPNTMQRAFQELERLGLVYTMRSSGRYVTEDVKVIDETRETLAREHISAFVESMKALGFDKKKIIAWIESEENEINGNL